MYLGATIQRLRKKRGLTQADIKRATGLNVSYLSQIEGNQKEPSLEMLRKIAGALDVPLPVLMLLTLDGDDVPVEKRQAFNRVWPAQREMIEVFFLIAVT